jgi:hypothetical protein
MLLTAVLVANLTAAAGAGGQAAPPDCRAPEHRQFDFWIGTWQVTANGKPAGTNRIEADLEGCVLVERWTSAGGTRGMSLNYYDRQTKSWYQAWIDDNGQPLRLKGGLVDGRMTMETEPSPGGAGGPSRQRITWSVEQDGSVRQWWQASRDGGATWTTVFDGRYVKAPGASAR